MIALWIHPKKPLPMYTRPMTPKTSPTIHMIGCLMRAPTDESSDQLGIPMGHRRAAGPGSKVTGSVLAHVPRRAPSLCWQANGAIDGKSRPLRIHALLDDASRFVVAIEARHSERESDMLEILVRALRWHGPPDVLYLDNGSTYIGEILRTACARLGISLLPARPYDAPARGKMERFWRTLREGCLDHLGSLTSRVGRTNCVP